MRLLIVGNDGGTNIGGSFLRAAKRFGWTVELLPSEWAMKAPWLIRQLSWRLMGRRPPRLKAFSAVVSAACERIQPQVLLATGTAPVAAHVIREASARGVSTIVFLTDDPFALTHRAPWFLSALRHYQIAASPRRANMDELRRFGCRKVVYVPFGYDPDLHYPVPPSGEMACDVLFVGGYEPERAAFLRPLAQHGLALRVYGDWRWGVQGRLRDAYRGQAGPDELRGATCSAGANVVLGRRQNRDGHTMRTFEVLACGGALLAEDTGEQRELLAGFLPPESFFSSPHDLAVKARGLIDRPERRAQLAERGRMWLTNGAHRYDDRLRELVTMTAAHAPAT